MSCMKDKEGKSPKMKTLSSLSTNCCCCCCWSWWSTVALYCNKPWIQVSRLHVALNHFLLLYVIHPPTLPHRAASPQLFMALMCLFFLVYDRSRCVVFCLFSLFLSCFSPCASVCVSRSRYLPVFSLNHSLSLSLFIPLRSLRDRLLLALAVFLFGIYAFSLLLFFLFFFAKALISASHCCFFVFLFFSPLHHHCHHLSFLLHLSLCFSLAKLPSLLRPLYTPFPSLMTSSSFLLLPPCPHPPPPASLSPAPGCQTLPSRPRGKAKAVDFSPHQAF